MTEQTLYEVDLPKRPLLEAVSVRDLLNMDFPPRENVLDPWLPRQGLAMIHARCGIGKTHLSLGIAYAVASGSDFLRWQAPEPRGVLLIDGEMPASALQERLAKITVAADHEPTAPFKIITPDLQERGMPNLCTEEGRDLIQEHVTDDIDLIIVDNLSTLARGGRENDAESWEPVQLWALGQRARGKSLLFIHHSGKGGQQRGTSKKEDVLDTVITLRRPPDYDPKDGAVFEVHFEKSRGIHGDAVESFEAKLATNEHGLQCWVMRTLEESNLQKVADMLKNGLRQQEISQELGLSKGYVSKLARQGRDKGLVSA